MVLGGEKMSEIMTKRALEQALKSVLKTKNLKKVTIQDIADECGINRNTFYYIHCYFRDALRDASLPVLDEIFGTVNWK